MYWYSSIYVPVLNIPWNDEHRVLVNYKSNMKYKVIVEKMAYHLKREQHYDFATYTANEDPSDESYSEYEAYIFLENDLNLKEINDPTKSLGIGACCFRKRIGVNDKYFWSLAWIWMHPYYRHRGTLTKHWEYFTKKYNDFYIEPPYSLEMEKYIEKIKWEEKLEKYFAN